jgi:hypothetical protein
MWSMEITLETLRKFCQHYAQGDVSFLDSKGTTRILKSGEPDLWDLAEKADQFFYLGMVHTRVQFAALMEVAMRPANSTQIG